MTTESLLTPLPNALTPWPWETPEPGIYFNMPDEEYFAIKCLSASGLKDLQVSPMDFWVRSWMNPYKEEDRGEEDSEAKLIGKAYHKRLLEGREAFYHEYAYEFSADGIDQDDILKSLEDLKEACRERELPVSGTKDVLTTRLLEYDPTLLIWEDMKRSYEEDNHGKTFLNERLIRRIELSAAMIENHPRLKYFFVGGMPEVTVIWDDPQLGVRMKSRFDYLKIGAVNDLKTFANQMKRQLDYAIFNEVKYRLYHLQSAVYLRAVEEAKGLAADGKTVGDVNPAWLEAFIKSPEHGFNFVFQQKGLAPVAKDAPLQRSYSLFREGDSLAQSSVSIFTHYFGIYGESPWVDLSEPVHLNV